MKLIYSLLTFLIFMNVGLAQDRLYLKYEIEVEATSDDGEMMKSMMEGSYMELAMSPQGTWVKSAMGSMMTMTMEFEQESDEITMLMEGLMGTMAYRGTSAELNKNEDDVDTDDMKMELLDETKKILGYKCKKAVFTDEEGNQAIYWYTDKFERPDAIEQMPNQVPGLCFEMEIRADGDVKMIYTVVELKENIDFSDYKVIIPEGVEVQSFDVLNQMGGN